MKEQSLKFGFFSLICGALLLGLGVLNGAFGAHALEFLAQEYPKRFSTYQTGVTYQFYHAFALLIVGLCERQLQTSLRIVSSFYILGILFFSSNCYFYALSGERIFAMLVPVGGVLFIVGHFLLAYKLFKIHSNLS